MVITLVSDTSNPGSIPGTTCFFFVIFCIFLVGVGMQCSDIFSGYKIHPEELFNRGPMSSSVEKKPQRINTSARPFFLTSFFFFLFYINFTGLHFVAC